jgi:hypothetical protein
VLLYSLCPPCLPYLSLYCPYFLYTHHSLSEIIQSTVSMLHITSIHPTLLPSLTQALLPTTI